MAEASTPMNLLESALQACWTLSTSFDTADWTHANPALGQDDVTALVVQDFLGGDILRSSIQGRSHFQNRLSNGAILDYTASQFQGGVFRADGKVETKTREEMLAYDGIGPRYTELKEAVLAWISAHGE